MTIEEMLKELPPDLQQEVENLVRLLWKKQFHNPKGQLKLDWRGAMSDLRDQYTSVELQHKISYQ